MTPVGSVAKAIYLDRNGEGGTPWGHLPDDHKAPYISDAKAAIRALAENVTDEMAWQTMTEKDDVRAAILAALEEE